MIVYNVTSKVRWDILEGWLNWQLERQIPSIMATGLFDNHQVFRLLEQDEDEGPTFVVQFFTSSIDRYQQFVIEFGPAMQQEGYEKWGNGFISFRTLLESV
ncbi:DUF4286 family protein [Puia sp. P3]|uniref:DUF4286 family protein n=1 Tax=Puia sp. P3 TaxID=3423952 RepID=UPI003D66D32F